MGRKEEQEGALRLGGSGKLEGGRGAGGLEGEGGAGGTGEGEAQSSKSIREMIMGKMGKTRKKQNMKHLNTDEQRIR